MKKLNLFLMLVLLGFGVIVQTAQAQLTVAPVLPKDSTAVGPAFNARHAVAPYAQVTANATYTFIGISHPSLATAHTSIGVAVEAIDMTTVPNTAAGRAAVFTVNAGETHRVFIVNQSHSTINGNNSSFTDSNTHLITTTDASQFGNIKVTGIGSHPNVPTTAGAANGTGARPGSYNDGGDTVTRLDNVSQLSMWGVVYQSSNGAGFALEFIGDMHDSSASSAVNGFPATHGKSAGAGRGIN